MQHFTSGVRWITKRLWSRGRQVVHKITPNDFNIPASRHFVFAWSLVLRLQRPDKPVTDCLTAWLTHSPSPHNTNNSGGCTKTPCTGLKASLGQLEGVSCWKKNGESDFEMLYCKFISYTWWRGRDPWVVVWVVGISSPDLPQWIASLCTFSFEKYYPIKICCFSHLPASLREHPVFSA